MVVLREAFSHRLSPHDAPPAGGRSIPAAGSGEAPTPPQALAVASRWVGVLLAVDQQAARLSASPVPGGGAAVRLVAGRGAGVAAGAVGEMLELSRRVRLPGAAGGRRDRRADP